MIKYTGRFPETKLLRVITYSNWVLIAMLCGAAVIFPYIGPDGGYYLSVARDFYQDKVGIYNMVCGYNPLAILILGSPYGFSDLNPYQNSVLILILVQIVNAILFYKILKKLEVPDLYMKIFTSFFLLYSLLLDGSCIVLEPVQNLFVLSATLSILYNKFFLTGIFVFLAFYSKQYSLAFMAGAFIYVILDNESIKKKIKNSLLFLTGFFVELVLFYFLLAKSIKFPDYFSSLTGISYSGLTSFSQVTGVGYNLIVFLKTFMWVILIAPVMFLWIIYLKDFRLNRITGLVFGNILGFSVVFLFAAYFHYFILFVPWFLILASLYISGPGLLTKINFKAIIFSVAFISVSLYTFKSIKNRMIIYEKEMKTAQNITSIIPSGSKVFVYGASPAQYIYSSLKSANSKELGYMFPNLRELNFYLDKMDEKSLILLNSRDSGKVAHNDKFGILAKTEQFTVFRKMSK